MPALLFGFLESLLSLTRVHWDHEPRNWSAGLRPGAVVTPRGRLAPGRRPALRFMESLARPLRNSQAGPLPVSRADRLPGYLQCPARLLCLVSGVKNFRL